jgi:threonine synthase
LKFISTRKKTAPLTFSESILTGLAPDGGLLIPDQLPQFTNQDVQKMQSLNFVDIAKIISSKFSENDSILLKNDIDFICEEAFNFPITLKNIKHETAVLELFQGPTCAFKDVGARFLASAISKIQTKKNQKLTILVATSGDTGSAVASAFFKKPYTDVIVLFPEGKISPRQEIQLTCWGENIKSFGVMGMFDDCQKMVKEIFLDKWWKENYNLISANSISIGRILPQTFYYAWSSLKYLTEHGSKPGFIIPSGNLGNAMACIWAKKMGFPIREIVMATNENHSVLDYFNTGIFSAHPTISTLANAMDVGNPSNFERVINYFPTINEFKKEITVISVNNDQISRTIQNGITNWNEIFCPHTATAMFAREQLNSPHWIVVATAHPSKFETIVEPLIHQKIKIPLVLERLINKPISKKIIQPNINKLKDELTVLN